jgi:hypothetical protein
VEWQPYARGHGHGFLHFDHNDEVHADPVGDWVHHRWEDTKHLAHDIYEAGHHAIDTVEDLTGIHVHAEEGEGMSGGFEDSEDSSTEIDLAEEEEIKAGDTGDHASGNVRALMAGKTLAELVADAGGVRKKAQASVLAKLNGKVHVSKYREPTAAFNYTSPPAPTPKQCKEGAKIQWRWAMTWQASASIEGAPGQHLLISFSDDPEGAWTKPMMIPIQPSNLAVWGPVWHLDDEGTIFLFFAQSTSCRKNAGRGRIKYAPGGDVKYIKSVDGVTWTSPKTIITQAADQGIPKLVANQLQVHSATGNWILPYW